MLELKNITKSFGDAPVLNGISLTLDKGRIMSILGPSGGGKTTLLNIILGITDATGGQKQRVALARTLEKDGGKWRYTSPTHVVLAFNRALDEMKAEGGIPARSARYATNNRMLIARMKALGFGTFLKEHQGPIITTFTYPEGVSFDFADMYAFIKERGYAIYPGKLTDEETFRLGNIGEIYPDDIRRVTELFAMYMAERGLLEPCAGTTDIAAAIEAMDEASAAL